MTTLKIPVTLVYGFGWSEVEVTQADEQWRTVTISANEAEKAVQRLKPTARDSISPVPLSSAYSAFEHHSDGSFISRYVGHP